MESQTSLFVVLLNLYFLLLQLSCGILNLYLGYNHMLGQCVDLPLEHSRMTLRIQMQSLGFF